MLEFNSTIFSFTFFVLLCFFFSLFLPSFGFIYLFIYLFFMIPFSRTHPELCWGLLTLAQESRYCPSPRNSMFSNLLLVAGHLPGWSIYTMESGKSFKSGPLSYRELVIKCLPAISDQYFLFLDNNKVLGYLNPFVSLLHSDIFSCHAFFFFFCLFLHF